MHFLAIFYIHISIALQEIERDLGDKYDELGQRIVRSKKMDTLVQELQMQRNLMGTGKAKKVEITITLTVNSGIK